jgi:hypothetical protein
MKGPDIDSPLAVSTSDDSNAVDKKPSRSSSPTESPTEGLNSAMTDELKTNLPLENGSSDALITETTSEPGYQRSTSFISDYSKPDPPGSVDAGFDGTTKEVPDGTDTTQETSEDKPRLDYINVPSLLREDLEELEEEGDPELSLMSDESHVARVLADMRQSSPEAMTDDDNDDDERIKALGLDVKEQGTSSPSSQIQRVYNAPTLQQSSPLVLLIPEERQALYGPDGIPFLPRVDRKVDRYAPPPSATHALGYVPQAVESQSPYRYAPIRASVPSSEGRRKIRLRLQEDTPRNLQTNQRARSGSFLGHIRRRSSRMMFGSDESQAIQEMADPFESTTTDRGSITVSWFDGTSSLELQEHVRKSVIRKLKVDSNVELNYIRVIDETVDPPEGKKLQTVAPNAGSSASSHAVCSPRTFILYLRNCAFAIYSGWIQLFAPL